MLLRFCSVTAARAIAFAVTLLCANTLSTPARAMSQTCVGILQIDGNSILLEPDATPKSPWCSATIGEDLNSAVAKTVLRKCPIGSTCRIAGDFAGHGVFSWTKLKSVSLVKFAMLGAEDLSKRCKSTTSTPAAAVACLTSLDGAYGQFLTETYQGLRNRLSGKARAALIDEQTKWLVEQTGSCGALDKNAKASCMVQTTMARISSLRARG